MPFKFDPEEIPDGKVWRGKCFHLTYAHWFDLPNLISTVVRATSTPLAGYSYVWEDTSYTDENGVFCIGHRHSHAALIFSTPINLIGARKFDVTFYVDDEDTGETEQIISHPMIQPKCTMAHMEDVFGDYHAGRKYSVEHGKTVFKKPIQRWLKLPEQFEFQEEIMKEMIAAPTLIEACMAGKVRPRTVTDVMNLRNCTASQPKQFKPTFPLDSFVKMSLPDDWGALWLWGPSNIGKTKWALHMGGKNPLLIKPFNSIGGLEAIKKKFKEGFHDVIVCDEADLSFLQRPNIIAFLDIEDEFQCTVRYGQFELPAGVKKIFLSNPDPVSKNLLPHFSDPNDGAIRRRCVVRNVTEPLYITAAAGTQPNVPTPQAALNSAFTPVTQTANSGWRAGNDVLPAPPPPPAI